MDVISKPEEALQNKLKNPDLTVVVGSRLYGTARFDIEGNCLSDTDLRSIVVPPWEYFTCRNFEQTKGYESEDHQIYSLSFFIKHILAGNPQFLEMLFSPFVQDQSWVGKELLNQTYLFVSKRFYKRLTGFAYSEWRKARMVELESSPRTKTEDDVINDIRNIFGPGFGNQQKEKMDEVLSTLFSCHDRKEIPSVNKINGKRLQDYTKYGYGVSSACHSLRLIRQCTELLRKGTISFPRPDAWELAEIKNGRMSLEQVEVLYNDALKEAEDAEANSILPDSPNYSRVQKLYEDIVCESLKNDERLFNHISKIKKENFDNAVV